MRDQRRLAAIVSVDAAGYSRLMGMDESATLEALKSHRRELIDRKIDEFRGRIVKTMGDGLLLEFPSVVDAVRCAVDVQRGMARRNADIPSDRRIEFRVGINVGDIIIDGEDIHGDGVNVAARLQALAEPGGVYVSRAVRDQVLDKLDFSFVDLGEQHAKNIARPIEVFRVDLDSTNTRLPVGFGWRWRRATRVLARPWLAAGALVLALAAVAIAMFAQSWKETARSTPPAMSVAIRPLGVPDGGTAGRSLAESLRRDLATQVLRFQDIVVLGGETKAGSPTDTQRAPVHPNVRYVVDGEVRSTGAGDSIDLRLVDTSSGMQIWGKQYQLPARSATSERNAWLYRIGRDIYNVVIDAETRRVLALPLERLDAVELVLVARQCSHYEARTLANIRKARELYEAASRLDPNRVSALVGQIYALDAENDYEPHPEHDRIAREMDDVSLQAVRVGGEKAYVWRLRADSLALSGRWPAAMEAVDMSIRLSPDVDVNRREKARLLTLRGQPTDALAIVDDLLAKNTVPDGELLQVACETHLLLGGVDRAIAACERASGLLNSDWYSQLLLAAAHGNRGDLGKATAAKDRLLSMRPGFTIAQLRAKRYSETPDYLKLAETYLYPGLRKAGLPEQ